MTYVRWGRTTCPSTPGTGLVYKGRAAGSDRQHSGGGASKLCLPDNPNYLRYDTGSGTQGGLLYGVEYEAWPNQPLGSVDDHNVPCAVCYTSTRGTVLVIPAKTSCPSAWTREYYGYLMTEYYTHHRGSFDCVDKDPESVPGSAGNVNDGSFHHTETTCSGLPCPPYVAGREITCAVCTK